MINEAEAKFRIPIRKKAGAKRQGTCTQEKVDAISEELLAVTLFGLLV
jgi:hypothetical protein